VSAVGPAGSSLTATFTNPDGTPQSVLASCASAATPTATNTPGPPTATPVATLTPTATATPAGYQVITVQKAMCNRINSNTNSCNGSDASLTGYTVTYDVYVGATPATRRALR